MNEQDQELEGLVALVTGSAKNIGRATNLALSRAGAKVVINALTSIKDAQALADEINHAGGEAMAYAADIRDDTAVNSMIDATVERFGGLNILINNASLRQLAPLDELNLDKWRDVFAVTVEGAVNCTLAAVPHLRAAGRGTVINVSGIASQLGVKDRLHAATANAALEGMVRSLARELAQHGITVNAVSPGLIDTVRGASAGKLPASVEAVGNLLGRKGRPEEIAAMICALCGTAGRYVTGQTICVNGGMYFAQ